MVSIVYKIWEKGADSSQLILSLTLVHTYAYWGLPDWKINVTINFRQNQEVSTACPNFAFCNSLIVNVKSVYFASMLDQKDGLKEAYEATVFVYVIHNFFEIIVILASLNMYLIY